MTIVEKFEKKVDSFESLLGFPYLKNFANQLKDDLESNDNEVSECAKNTIFNFVKDRSLSKWVNVFISNCIWEDVQHASFDERGNLTEDWIIPSLNPKKTVFQAGTNKYEIEVWLNGKYRAPSLRDRINKYFDWMRNE